MDLREFFRDRNAHFLVNYITQDNNDEHKLKQKELNEKAYGELEKCGKNLKILFCLMNKSGTDAIMRKILGEIKRRFWKN